MKRIVLVLALVAGVFTQTNAQYLSRGFWGGFELTYGLSLSDKGGSYHNKFGGDTKMQIADARAVFGYYFTKTFSLGTGVGVATYSSPRINFTPIFIDMRIHPFAAINENFYFSGNFGTSLANNHKHINPKWLAEATFGYQLFDFGGCTLAPSIGYSYFKYNRDDVVDNQVFVENKQKRHSLFIRLSFTY